jgi:peptidoglycan/LPS O-acetylase OafA/YrhL
MLVSLPFAWIYLLPSSLIDFSKTILYSLGFSSNFYFWYSGQQYGAELGLLQPFLHSWSLSVEEQYYILFPIVLLITFKYFKKYLIHIFILGFVISLGLADWGSRNHPSFNFYVLPSRGYELLAGSILAYFEITLGHRSKYKTLNLILSSIGLLLIGHSILFFNDKMFHPSFYTLSPIIGVCLIIWFSHKDELITKILSTKLFVGIGLISYSLYLWHYPIFAFGRIINFTDGSIFKKLLIGIIILILSIVSYYFIERPARNKKYEFKNVFLLIILISLFIFILNISTLTNKFLYFKFNVDSIALKDLIEFNEFERTRNYWNKCKISVIKDNNYCKIGNSTNKVFLIGDSQTIPLIRNLGEKLNKKNYELNIMVEPGFFFREKLKDNKRVNFLKNIKNSIFVFGGYYQKESKESLDSIYEYYKKDFELFRHNNNDIIFLYPIPEISFAPYIDLLSIKRNEKSEISIDKNKVEKRNRYAVSIINDLENIYRVYPNEIFCDKVKCYAVDPNKNILKSDTDHPSKKGAEMINDLIMKEIEKIELKSN